MTDSTKPDEHSTPKPGVSGDFITSLFATASAAVSDAATAQFAATLRRRTREAAEEIGQMVTDGLEQLLDMGEELLNDRGTESPAPKHAPTDTAGTARDASDSTARRQPADVTDLVPGQEVWVKATLVAVGPAESMLVELTSKTDMYEAWVRSDLVTVEAYTEPELKVGDLVEALNSDERTVSWAYLPTDERDPAPFIVIASHDKAATIGSRHRRDTLPTHIHIQAHLSDVM